MFKKIRIQNLNSRIHRIYDKKFSHIETVLNSCTTHDQIYCCVRWASEVIQQYHEYEKERLDKLYNVFDYIDMVDIVDEYFDLKQDIVYLLSERKTKEI